MTGRRPDKFEVRHYRRGAMPPSEVFVLVPGRDPAAVAALRTYADRTPDVELAAALVAWTALIDGGEGPGLRIGTAAKVSAWTATLAAEVKAGRMDVETALQRIAGHAIDSARRETGAGGLRPGLS